MNKILGEILRANRAEPEVWITSWLTPKLKDLGCSYIIDEEFNVYVPPTNESDVLFVAHTDTVDSPIHGDRGLHIEKNIVELAAGQSNRCLGADDGAGIYVLLQLIKAGVSGGYLFTTGEESGGIGVMHFISRNQEEIKRYTMCLEFDRYGYDEIITNQSPGDCASDEFATSLSDILNAVDEGFDFAPSEAGIYTDNADLSEFIPECVNVAIGYYGHHTPKEWLDFNFVDALIEAVVVMDRTGAFEALPIVREAGDYGKLYNVPWNTYTNDVPYEVTNVQGFVKEYPAVVTEFLENIGVDLWELNEFANKAGYDIGREYKDDWDYSDVYEGTYNASNDPY